MENKSNAKRTGRGGKREGAGRKTFGAVKRVTVAFSVDPETKEKLQRLADEQGVSMSEYMNRLIQSL